MEIIALDNYNIHVGNIQQSLQALLGQRSYSQVLVLTDTNTAEHCLPVLKSYLPKQQLNIIQIPAGEQHKHIETCQLIWKQMMELGTDRKALLINLGGGVIGDMGGFCASTFKRGLDFIQIPTTLLSQVDASIGGKLGIDFMKVKNSIGLFNNPQAVFIDPVFLQTLPFREIRSGFAEIIKHSLIADYDQWVMIRQISDLKGQNWASFLVPSLKIKQRIVEEDPFEKGLRKALNFGHTIGHAIEGHALETSQPLLHGEAIAIGFICESYLAHKQTGLQRSDLEEIGTFIQQIYQPKALEERYFDEYLHLMGNDKKNEGKAINFTLIKATGEAVINQTASAEMIVESLRFYNDFIRKTH
ncbi:MAG: 3-dehydroquinate synthase [Saprospiraceae bacterium]|nr:3-dehydroquinate synthase [Saprospiraceae bacterium]